MSTLPNQYPTAPKPVAKTTPDDADIQEIALELTPEQAKNRKRRRLMDQMRDRQNQERTAEREAGLER